MSQIAMLPPAPRVSVEHSIVPSAEKLPRRHTRTAHSYGAQYTVHSTQHTTHGVQRAAPYVLHRTAALGRRAKLPLYVKWTPKWTPKWRKSGTGGGSCRSRCSTDHGSCRRRLYQCARQL